MCASSHCALNAARCIVVCQVRLSAKRIGTRQYARLVDEGATRPPARGLRHTFSPAHQGDHLQDDRQSLAIAGRS